MKLVIVIGFCLSLTLTVARAQTVDSSTAQSSASAALPPPTAFKIIDNGPNHRVWQRETYERGPNGQVFAHAHVYTELASGLNYLQNGQYVESQELIEPFSGGAVAMHGQQQVIFANNLNTAGAIDLQTPDGKRLVSNIIGLEYYDNSTGNSVLIGQIQDSQGELANNNQVIYHNAFTGLNADVCYTYKKGSFQQDVILNQQPPSPESCGLNPETTEIVVMTEFLNPPQATTSSSSSDADQFINFGAMTIGRGKAFNLGSPLGEHLRIHVLKNYENIGGRQILFERVRLKDAYGALSSLPLQSQIDTKLPFIARKDPVLPRVRQPKMAGKPIKMAKHSENLKGFVLDYIAVNSTVNFTLKGDSTYLVTDWLYLQGLTTIEGGAVIKFNDNPANYSSLDFYNNWLCKATEYHPAVFTSMDDNTVGETISGSTGNPFVITNSYYFVLDGLTNASVNNLRFCYAQYPLVPDYAGPVEVRDCQFVNCLDPLDNWLSLDIHLHNVLFAGCPVAVTFDGGAVGSLTCENVTASCGNLVDTNAGQAVSICLTNSIIFNSAGSLWAANVFNNCSVINPSGTIFQSAGAGSYYLANGSPYHNAGTTNISPQTLADIQSKTTYPPLVCSNVTFSVATNLGPAVPRDTNSVPDIGYHYDPMDYAFGGVKVYSNVTFAAGTSVGWFELPGSGGAGYGISAFDKVVVAFNGTATQPCVLARYSTVQEGGDGLWTDKGYLSAITAQSLSGGYGMDPANAAQIMPVFTRHCGFPGDPCAYREYNALIKICAQNSQFESAGIGAYWNYGSFTNCLFDRTGASVAGSNPAQYWLRNCTFHGGVLALSEFGQTWPVWIEDCAFDGTSLSVEDNSGGNTNETYMDFNAFVTSSNSVSAPGTHNVYVTNFNWQASWFGNFYLPTNSLLNDHGSVTADQFGLFHFTTQTSQAKEGFTPLDIGYHSVATDNYGHPLDSNGDGTLDYLEDANGNGIYDAGDSAAWNVMADPTIPAAWYSTNGLDAGSPTIGIQDPDWDGLLNQQEYLYGTKPQVSEGFSIWTSSGNGTTVIP